MTPFQEKAVKDFVSNCIDDMFIGVHSILHTTSGDITPDQVLKLDQIKEELSKLIIEQVNQNL